MADPQHLKWLLDGVETWNARLEHENFQPDLSGANLFGVFAEAGQLDDLGRIPLTEVNLLAAELNGATFVRADLSGANLGAAQAAGAQFFESDLSGANLFIGHFEGADFARANLSNAKLDGVHARGADFSGANLSGCRCYRSDFTNADLSDANLFHARMDRANLAGAILLGSKPWQAVFYRESHALSDLGESVDEPVETVSDLLTKIRCLNPTVSLYFRGEPKRGMDLSASLVRDELAQFEGQMLLDLISKRPKEMGEMSTVLDQWVLARHHGLKTRFLDVTKNPLVALYFACEHDPDYQGDDACLHVFAMPEWLNKSFNSDTISVIANFARLSKEDQDLLLSVPARETDQPFFDRDRYKSVVRHLYQLIRRERWHFEERIDAKDLYGVFVFEPQQSVERVRSQSGAFLVSAYRDRFDYSDDTDWNGGVRAYDHVKLTIPSVCKPEIIRELRLLNVTREALFPGLDSTAATITDRYRPGDRGS